VLNGAVGVGSATAAVVSTRNAARTSARIGAYQISGLAEAPTLFELGLFCSAGSAFGKRNLAPKNETRQPRSGFFDISIKNLFY
jgi:hypothetical protein